MKHRRDSRTGPVHRLAIEYIARHEFQITLETLERCCLVVHERSDPTSTLQQGPHQHSTYVT